MITKLLSATLLPRVCAALALACAVQLGVIAWMADSADDMREKIGELNAKLDLANGAVDGFKREAKAASKRAQEAEKAASAARVAAKSKINAVRAVRPSGDACDDARRLIRAYRQTP